VSHKKQERANGPPHSVSHAAGSIHKTHLRLFAQGAAQAPKSRAKIVTKTEPSYMNRRMQTPIAKLL